MELGTLGIWSMQLRGADRPAVRDAAAELDALGFSTLWIPGLDGHGVFDDMGALLGAAPHSVVALGVLGVWGQRPSDVGQRSWARWDLGWHVSPRPGPLGCTRSWFRRSTRGSNAGRSGRLH